MQQSPLSTPVGVKVKQRHRGWKANILQLVCFSGVTSSVLSLLLSRDVQCTYIHAEGLRPNARIALPMDRSRSHMEEESASLLDPYCTLYVRIYTPYAYSVCMYVSVGPHRQSLPCTDSNGGPNRIDVRSMYGVCMYVCILFYSTPLFAPSSVATVPDRQFPLLRPFHRDSWSPGAKLPVFFQSQRAHSLH